MLQYYTIPLVVIEHLVFDSAKETFPGGIISGASFLGH
jgi:hypothetical protein